MLERPTGGGRSGGADCDGTYWFEGVFSSR